MKLTKMIEAEYEADNVQINVAVRYDEEDIPNDFPGRERDTLRMTIDINTGVIRNWPKDHGAFDLYMNVCDQGSYRICDKDDNVIYEVEEDYVPGFVPGKYGDYIDFKIDATGKIANWPSKSKIQNAINRDED
jgi:hypothetical protein